MLACPLREWGALRVFEGIGRISAHGFLFGDLRYLRLGWPGDLAFAERASPLASASLIIKTPSCHRGWATLPQFLPDDGRTVRQSFELQFRNHSGKWFHATIGAEIDPFRRHNLQHLPDAGGDLLRRFD
jgi:hypothetical protein